MKNSLKFLFLLSYAFLFLFISNIQNVESLQLNYTLTKNFNEINTSTSGLGGGTGPSPNILRINTTYNITSVTWSKTMGCKCVGVDRGSLWKPCTSGSFTNFNANVCTGGNINLPSGCYDFAYACGTPLTGYYITNYSNVNCGENGNNSGTCDPKMNITTAVSHTYNNIIVNANQNNLLSTFTTRISSPTCEINRINNTGGLITDVNDSLICQTSPISSIGCQSVDNVQGTTRVDIWNVGCQLGQGNVITNMYFNTSGFVSSPQLSFCLVPNALFFNLGLATDSNNNAYLNKTGIFMTAQTFLNNTNYSVKKMTAQIGFDCNVNINSLNGNCSNLCVDNVLYQGAYFDSMQNACITSNATSQICSFGCSSLNSCGIQSTIFNQSSILNLNINGTVVVSAIVGVFTTPFGWALFSLFIIMAFSLFYLNEFFSIVIFSIYNFAMGTFGIFDTWIGFGMAFMGGLIVILNHEKFFEDV